MALTWAKECNWELGQPENISPYAELSQNRHLWVRDELDIDSAVAAWWDERKTYSFADNTCMEGRTCDGYKQLMWDDTDVVGCGYFLCDHVTGIQPEVNNVYYHVCYYAPP